MIDYTTPEGRIVQGDLFTPQTTDYEGRPLTDVQGNPAKKWFFALAIPKGSATELVQAMRQVAAQEWPAGESNQPTFSWKLVDGDTQPTKEGFAGCWVVRVSSGYAVRVVGADNMPIINPDSAKRGYYARAHLRIVGNGNRKKPGLFVNPLIVHIERPGAEIVSGPDAEAVFGPGVGAPGVPGVGAPGVPGVGAPGPMPPPRPEVLDPPLTAAAGAWTYRQYRDAGWDDAALRAAGYLV